MNLSGLNQLYGDGRVVWKPGKTMDKAKLLPQNTGLGLVKGYGGSVTLY